MKKSQSSIIDEITASIDRTYEEHLPPGVMKNSNLDTPVIDNVQQTKTNPTTLSSNGEKHSNHDNQL